MFMLMSFLVVLRMGMLMHTMVPGLMLVIMDSCSSSFVVVGVRMLMTVGMFMKMRMGMAVRSVVVGMLMLVLVFMRVSMIM